MVGYVSVICLLLTLTFPALADNKGMEILESRCSSCHDLKGPAPATLKELWARKGPDFFYAGNKYKRTWLESWLQKPRRIRPAGYFYVDHIKSTEDGDVIDDSTLKPHVALNAEEAHEVAEALMSLKANDHLITKGEYKPGKISLTMGEMRFDKFRGCMACHEIEPGYGGLSGPEVYTAAKRLQEDYMMSYMRDPQAWDPKIFMPNMHLREGDLEKFVHYFRALSEENFE
ncbi:MAG TPA: cytochrome C [Gammaproteobacteria bacterium]|nr:cytochrome C [Gammaproteobacteria bacterium]